MMLLSVRVIDKGRHPPLFTRDDLLTMIRVEDQFSGRRIRRLLTDFHHVERQPLDMIAGKIDVPVDTLRIWLYWLHIKELNIPLSVSDEAAVDIPPDDDTPFGGMPVGSLAQQIAAFYGQHRSWEAVVQELNDRYPGITVPYLQQWVRAHSTEFGIIGSDALRVLFGLKVATTPERSTAPTSTHASGVELSVEAQRAIAAQCSERDCTEKQLFLNLFVPGDMAATIPNARLLKLDPALFFKLVLYHNGGTLPEVTGG